MMILKNYLSDIKLSISSVNYYKEMLSKPFRNSFFFFLTSILIIGISRGSFIALTKLPSIKNDTSAALDDLEHHFDKDLEITWADDQLEINKESVNLYWPSTIDHKIYNLPNTIAILSNSEEAPSNSDIIEGKTLFYINKNSLYTTQNPEKKEVVEYPIKDILIDYESYSINKQTLPKIISSIKKTIDESFSAIQFGVAVASIIVFLISRIWFLITESIFVYFLFKIYTLIGSRNLNFSFKKILKLGLNILVPTEIIHLVNSIFYADLNLPMDSISFWVILTFIVFNLKKK